MYISLKWDELQPGISLKAPRQITNISETSRGGEVDLTTEPFFGVDGDLKEIRWNRLELKRCVLVN